MRMQITTIMSYRRDNGREGKMHSSVISKPMLAATPVAATAAAVALKSQKQACLLHASAAAAAIAGTKDLMKMVH